MNKRINYFSISLIVFLVNLFIIQVSIAAQVENTVTCDEGVIAEPLSMMYGDSTINCAINPATDLDRFTFSGEINDQVRISVLSTTNGLDPDLEIRDPDGVIIINGAIDGAGCSSNLTCSFTIDLTLLKSGVYSLALSDAGVNNTGNYFMQVEKIIPTPPSLRIDYDSFMIDTISPPTDVDHFNFYATAGTDIRLNVLSITNGLDPVFEIRDSNGTVIVDGTIDGASCISNLTCSFSVDLSPAASGFYTLIFYDINTNNTGNYQISLWCMFGPCDSDGDMVPDLPATIISYDTPIIDTLNPQVDGDFFTFNATAGTDIRFNVLSTTNGLDPVFEVRDPNGLVVINGAADGASCASNLTCSFSVNYSPVVTGTYSLIIYDINVNNTGNYQLNLWCMFGPCDSNGDGDPDPNGPLLSYVTATIDTLSPAVDADFFTFNATAGTDIQFNVLSTTNGLDPVFEVRDPDGNVIINGAADGASCSSNLTCSFSLAFSPTLSGIYSLILYDIGINNTGVYQLSLWCLQGNCDSDADGIADGDRQNINYGVSIIDNSINFGVDADFYLYSGTAGDDIRFNVLSTTNGLDPIIVIRDPSGTVIVNGLADGAGCISNLTCSFTIDLTLVDSGTYSLAIYDSGVNNTGNYQLSLQCLFGSCTDLPALLICVDNCSNTVNPLQIDSDGDGYGYGNQCDADLDNTGLVNFADLNLFRACFGTSDPDCDFDGNGFVNLTDLNLLKLQFGKPPGPSCHNPNQP